jgi:hypothetical protein
MPSDEARRVNGTLELRFRDAEEFEYRLVLQNAGSAPYTTLAIHRMGASTPLANLATDVELQGSYVQMRGTGAARVMLNGATLLEALRRSPGDFEVRLTGSTGGTPLLRGVIQ